MQYNLSILAVSILLTCLTTAQPALSADLAFKPAEQGWVSFDTGALRGKLQADAKSQGIPTFIDVSTGTELAHGGGNPGILSFYRLLSANKRWGDMARGDMFRQWPQDVKTLPDGAAQVHWPSRDDHPVDVTATFRWTTPTTLDLETIAKPGQDMPAFEVLLSSYFNKNSQNGAYVQAPVDAPGKPYFLTPQGNPLVAGTYLAYPRDLRAAQNIFDTRWEQGSHSPIQWSVTRFLAAPIALSRDVKTGITVVLMARPQDCFAIRMPYNQTPPDRVSAHHSIYLSLFGGDLKAGQTARALLRLTVGRDITDAKAVELYNAFLNQTKDR